MYGDSRQNLLKFGSRGARLRSRRAPLAARQSPYGKSTRKHFLQHFLRWATWCHKWLNHPHLFWVEPAQPESQSECRKKSLRGFWGNFGVFQKFGLSRLNPNFWKIIELSRLNPNFWTGARRQGTLVPRQLPRATRNSRRRIILSPISSVRGVKHLFTVCICFSSVFSYSHLPFHSCPCDIAPAPPLKVGERWRDLCATLFFLKQRKTETKKVLFFGSL